MTEETRDGESRRKFLTLAAGAAAAAAVGGVIGSLPGIAEGADPESADPEGAGAPHEGSGHGESGRKKTFAYVIDTTKCIGCGSCARACQVENDVPESVHRTWIERYEVSTDGQHTYIDSPNGGRNSFEPVATGQEVGKAFFVPKMCNHCEETPCVQVCPVGASYYTPEGVVLVDEEQCIGCGYCVQACPYASRYIHPVTHTAGKCTWCYHRTTKGLMPACVEACPTETRRFGDRNDPDDPIHDILATERYTVLQPQLLTKPKCYYIGLSMEVR